MDKEKARRDSGPLDEARNNESMNANQTAQRKSTQKSSQSNDTGSTR